MRVATLYVPFLDFVKFYFIGQPNCVIAAEMEPPLEDIHAKSSATCTNAKYIVEGSSIPRSFQRATSILSGRTVTQFNQITTGNTGEDLNRGIGYAAGVAFGRNVLGNTSVIPRLVGE